MPEGPEVRTFARLLKLYKGKKLLKLIQSPRFTKYKLNSILNKYLNHVIVKGKKTTLVFNSRKNVKYFRKTNVFLTIHLNMTGSWSQIESDKYQMIFRFSGKKSLYFSDPRTWSNFEIHDYEGWLNVMDQLGPDLLATGLMMIGYKIHPAEEKFVIPDKYLSSLSSTMKLDKFLLDQKKLSGIGNYLRADLLYRSKLNPRRRFNDLTHDEKKRMFKSAIEVITSSYMGNGVSIRDYECPDEVRYDGEFEVICYGCSKCPLGHVIDSYLDGKDEKQGRRIWYCGTCQK